MSSNGGSMGAEAAGRLAVRTAVSGPAGGVAGAFALSRQADYDRIITLDMGGTSTDVSLCPGRILEKDETSVGGLPIRGATVDVLSVGAGGGSIARLDAGGALRVGPESAGADPGPACYGRGDSATVTDAQVVLGRVTPEHFLGGQMRIDAARSLKALRQVAAPFDGDTHRAAEAVLRVANANMEAALRVVSVERGHDPRDFTLVAFGGAGPLHACDLAASLRIARVLVPEYPGVLSALGMAHAPVVKELTASVLQRFDPSGTDRAGLRRLRKARDELDRRARAELQAEGFDLRGCKSQTILDMRYAGQSYELPIPVRGELDSASFVRVFHRAHRDRYSHGDTSRPVEVVNVRVKLVLPPPTSVGEPSGRHSTKASMRRAPAATERRKVCFSEGHLRALDTPFYDRGSVSPGHTMRGPAVVTQMDCTTVIPPGWHARVDAFRNLLIVPVRPR
jgi:N-methylhydantoinase A